MKAPRKGNLVTPSPSVEVDVEQQILAELQGLKGQVRDLRTILMGDGDDGETAYGRLPMVETKVAAHQSEIEALKKEMQTFQFLKTQAAGVGHWVSGILGSVVGGLVVGIAMLLLHVCAKLFP